MAFIYETHLHTSEASRCGGATGVEMVREHVKRGFTGIFVTDHFVTGYSHANISAPWAKRIDILLSGYLAAKKAGDELGLDVFFAWEYPYHSGDFLTYGLGADFLYAHKELADFEPNRDFEGYAKLIHENGGYIIQAHPFREAEYMDFKAAELQERYIDAIEAINGSHRGKDPNYPRFDTLATQAAERLNIPMSAGSDTHAVYWSATAYMAFDHRLKDSRDFITQMKAKKYELIQERRQKEDFL